MAIDADLSSGLIDEDEARARREDLNLENSFFGSMDGAAKFVAATHRWPVDYRHQYYWRHCDRHGAK